MAFKGNRHSSEILSIVSLKEPERQSLVADWVLTAPEGAAYSTGTMCRDFISLDELATAEGAASLAAANCPAKL